MGKLRYGPNISCQLYSSCVCLFSEVAVFGLDDAGFGNVEKCIDFIDFYLRSKTIQVINFTTMNFFHFFIYW